LLFVWYAARALLRIERSAMAFAFGLDAWGGVPNFVSLVRACC
jgi:hypothetical protein